MLIQILGIGCEACGRMEQDVRAIVHRLGLQANIERVKDPESIARFGVFVIPALVIDGEVVTAGYRGARRIEQVMRQKLGL